MSSIGYYYLHANGNLIFKLGNALPDLQDSSFVRAIWPCIPSSRLNAWQILVEGLAQGANLPRVRELTQKWGCTDADAPEYARRIGCVVAKTNEGWDAWSPNKLLPDAGTVEKTSVGHGSTALTAMADLAVKLGLQLNGRHGLTFEGLLDGRSRRIAPG